MVRAKFKVTGIEERYSGSRKVTLTCQYSPDIPEDISFNKSTPNGTIEMQIDNPAAIEAFPLGKFFYADFTPVEPAE